MINKNATSERSHFPAREVAPVKIALDQVDENAVVDLEDMGIQFNGKLGTMAVGLNSAGQNVGVAQDALEGLITSASIPVPNQFLQTFLPGLVSVVTRARKADLLLGLSTVGNWEDEEIIQEVLEHTGEAQEYGDKTNSPLASWNLNFERRTIVRFEEGLEVGRLEERRAARVNVNSAATKRNAAADSLEIRRNAIAFYGFNGGVNRTYGFLNDPNLPAYVSNPGPVWASATFAQITTDIRTMAAGLRARSGDNIDPSKDSITLAVASASVEYLSVCGDYGYTVRKWIADNYPNMRIESAPELNAANSSENVAYMYADTVNGNPNDRSTDNGRVFDQLVAAKLFMLGAQQETKGYKEVYSNATAGALLKRPWAIYRMTGI